MKKIMFNDNFGLTKAVITGKKTMTRRLSKIYKVGEIIAIAQSYSDLNRAGFLAPEWLDHTCENSAGYLNKMFVRADLMPYGIQITDLKKERLQDISDEDCLREGILIKSDFPYKKSYPYYFAGGKHEWDYSFSTPRKALAALIDKVCGKGTWASNPIVYAYSFNLIIF